MQSLDSHQEFLQWVVSHGGYIDDSVCIAQDASRGVHMQVRADWPRPVSPETRVFSTPLGITMSYYNAIDYRSEKASFSSHGVVFPRAFIDAVGPEETSVFFLMGQFLRGPESFWYPYLRTLPQPGQLTTPLFFEHEDVDWLQGTGILEAAVQRYEIWDREYDEAIAKLEELGFDGWEKYSWDLYLWASTITTSRAFSARVLSSAVEAADVPQGTVSVILPLIDLPNHRPLAKVEWRAGDKDIGMVVLENVGPGEEVANNYGPRNNEQLLMNYGFCIAGNTTDYRIVTLGVKPDSPLSKAKARRREMFPEVAKNTEDHYYIFNVYYPLLAPDRPMEHSIFSPALFNAMAVTQANQREQKQLEITESGIFIPTTYGNGRCTLAALAQISFELIAHIMMLHASGKDLPSQPANLKQSFAKIYRDGQITLDKTALVIASWTIARAREHNRTGEWSEIKALLKEHLDRIPTGHFTPDVLSRIQMRILERESVVKRNGELFRLGELFSLLPTDMQAAGRRCFDHLLGQASQQIPALGTDPQALFAIVIALLTATHRSSMARPRLPSRLTTWVEFLLEQYTPPTGTDIEPVSGKGRHSIDALGQLARTENAGAWAVQDGVTWLAKDSGWLETGWLQWAWRVVKEEMVLIPLDPLQVLATEDPGIAKQAVLYVPQEQQDEIRGSV